jgi:putative tryptophan/tyrosine transport system substrate-binding protein
VGGSTPASLAAKTATQSIPIIFAVGTDPVGVGLVASLAKPGGNATGVTNLNVELFKKCFELMHSLMPQGTTIAVLVNPANIPQTASERATVQDAARALGARVARCYSHDGPACVDVSYTFLLCILSQTFLNFLTLAPEPMRNLT